MNKALLILCLLSFIGAANLGCSRSKKIITRDTAPVNTYSVTYIDNTDSQNQDELEESIAIIISGLLADFPDINVNVTINLTNTVIGDFNGKGHVNNNNILNYCGKFNECPGLYEKLYFCMLGEKKYHDNRDKCKNRGRQLEEDCKKKSKKPH